MGFENLPEGWQQKKLEELIDVIHGYAFKGEDFSDKETSLILLTPGNFAMGGGFKAGKFKYFKEGVEFPQKYILNKNDLLITMTDLSKEGDTLGYPTLVPIIRGKILLHNQRLGKVEIKSTEIDKKYLYYGLCTKPYRDEVLASATGTTVKHTAPTRVLNYTLPYPPFIQQQKISSILSALDDKIELNNQMNQTLETMAKTLFKSWFVDFDPFQDGEFEKSELGMIPKGWKVGILSDLGNVITGKTPSTANEENYGNKYPFITIPDMHGQTFVIETARSLSDVGNNTQPKKLIPKNSVLVSCIATVGLVIINAQDSHTNQQINSIVCDSDKLHYIFLLMQGKTEDLKQLGSAGTATLNVNKSTFESIKVVLPDCNVLKTFKSKVASLFEQILQNQLENNTITKLRDSLLPKLMSGEIEVN
jgi:type I restriction enzyme S subunit